MLQISSRSFDSPSSRNAGLGLAQDDRSLYLFFRSIAALQMNVLGFTGRCRANPATPRPIENTSPRPEEVGQGACPVPRRASELRRQETPGSRRNAAPGSQLPR